MNKEFEKIIEKLEEYKYENLVEHDYEQSQHCKDIGDCEMRDCVLCVFDKAIEIVKQEAEKYEECYKDCGECEAYNKKKYHCPKFCKVITEAVKEIEGNHNIKGKWEMTYKGMRKDVNTGLMISAYNCKCSVCCWRTGNQGTRFKYCPMCGAKMDSDSKGE